MMYRFREGTETLPYNLDVTFVLAGRRERRPLRFMCEVYVPFSGRGTRPLRFICNASVPLVGATNGRPCASAPIFSGRGTRPLQF